LCAIGLREFDASVRWIEDATTVDSSSDFVLFATALVFVQTGDVTAAIQPLQRISERFVKWRDARVLLATALLCAGRFDEADAVACAVSEQDDEMRASLLALRARCAQGHADETAARTLYREALLYTPRSEWIRQALEGLPNLRIDSAGDNPEFVII
jgi:thioredoxin-like negative regulator of GroEL